MGYGETGGKSSLPIWVEYMKMALKKFGDSPHQVPAGINFQWIDKKTGRKAAPNSPGAIQEAFADESSSVNPELPEDSTQVPKPINKSDDEYYENQ